MLRYIADTIKYIMRSAKNSALYPFKRVIYKIRTQLAFKSRIGTIVAEKIRRLQKYLVGKPKSLKDYVEFKRFYVAKTVLVVAAILCIALPILGYFYVYPFFIQKYGTAVFLQTDADLGKYNGKVKVFTTDNKLVYHGGLKNGKSDGNGQLYDSEGRLIFDGLFVDGVKQGEGTEYYPDGKTKLIGEFKAGLAEGACIEYYMSGIAKYEGEFKAGLYNGQGKLNWSMGKQKYVGQFLNGIYSGSGSTYAEDGKLLYEGEFKEGKFFGSGVTYDNRKISYEGMFLDGLYHGKGRLYKSGELLYDGDFLKGQYSGAGKLYDAVKAYLIYEGEFIDGKYSGNGTLFSKDGVEIYTGAFSDNEISYTSLLGLNDADIRGALGKKFRTDMLAEGFCITNADTGVSAYLSYYDDDMESKALSITVWGENKVFGIEPGMNNEQIIRILGEPERFVRKSIEESEQMAMQSWEVNAVYRAYYTINDISVTFCFEEKEDKWLYAVIGSR